MSVLAESVEPQLRDVPGPSSLRGGWGGFLGGGGGETPPADSANLKDLCEIAGVKFDS